MSVGTTDVSAHADSVAILLTYGTARVLLARDAEVREEYVAEGSYTEPLNVVKVRKHKTP